MYTKLTKVNLVVTGQFGAGRFGANSNRAKQSVKIILVGLLTTQSRVDIMHLQGQFKAHLTLPGLGNSKRISTE